MHFPLSWLCYIITIFPILIQYLPSVKINVHSNQEGATLNIMLETIGGIWVVSEALTPKPSALYQLFTMMIRMDQSNCHLVKRFLWLLNIHEHESIFHFYFLHFSRICIIALIGTHQLKVSYPMAYWRNSLVGCFIDQWQRSSFQLSYYTVKCSLNMAAMCVRRTW